MQLYIRIVCYNHVAFLCSMYKINDLGSKLPFDEYLHWN